MASSSNITKYPPRLYEEGKSVLQNRSMNHNCFVSKIGIMKEELGEDVWTKLRESSLGVFIKLAEEPYTWAAQTVHYFLTHQLAVGNIHELWSLIDDRPIRFSLNEFADITKLNCDPIDKADNWDANHHDFWKEMGVPISDGPTFKELKKVMTRCKTFTFEKRMMVGRLCLLSVGIYGIHHASRVPLSSAKRVLDPYAFEKHPWGRVAFSSLVNSIKVVEYANDSYVIHGCVHALLIWVYESVPGLGESYGKRRSTLTGYPLLDWESSRKRINFEDFIKKEKAAYGQVRVRHMVDVSKENMYPNWSDANEKKDTELGNLIKDIIHKRLPVNAWEGVDALCLKKKKRKLEENVHRKRGRIQKQEKMKEDDYTDEEEEKVSNKKYKMGKEHPEDVEAEKISLLNIWKMLETMNGTISKLDNNLSRMDVLETKFESLVTEKAAFLDVQLRKRIDLLEKNLKDMKEPKLGVVPIDDVNSNVKEDDEADSKVSASKLEHMQNSDNEVQVPRVVKKVYTVKNNKKKEGEVSDDLPLFEKKNAPNARKEKVVSNISKKEGAKDGKKKVIVKQEKIDSPKPKKKKKRTDLNVDDVEDITDQVAAENHKMASSSEEALSAHIVNEETLKVPNAEIEELDGGQDQARCVPQLAESQKFPYVGNSTVKRIITDVIHYSETSEHLKPEEDEKVQRLMDFIKLDGNKDEFYCEIITPREEWPKEKYGWLRSYHMYAAMAMFRKRLMRDPSPYQNQRITFLDQYMIMQMVNDFTQFSISHKNFLFRDLYVNWCNGTTPIDSPTNKKWYIDIDHLYACFFVNENHWVALDINLPMKKIFIYDSIPTIMNDKEIVEACLPLRKMIPALLSVVVPETVRKKSYKMLDVKRVRKDVPLSQNHGDCGVFALKYIECLALGKTFDGICDRNMKALRIKLGAELFDEVRESNAPGAELFDEVRESIASNAAVQIEPDCSIGSFPFFSFFDTDCAVTEVCVCDTSVSDCAVTEEGKDVRALFQI